MCGCHDPRVFGHMCGQPQHESEYPGTWRLIASLGERAWRPRIGWRPTDLGRLVLAGKRL